MTIKSVVMLLVALVALSVTVATHPVSTMPAPIQAQADDPDACQSLVRQAMREIGSSCRELGRNEACYGNTRVDAELSANDLIFNENGDIVSVESLTRLTTQPANPDLGEWGIAVLDLQADLPESSDDAVRLLLFGGVDVVPTAPPGIDPNQPTCTLRNGSNTNINLRVGPGTDFTVVDSLRPDQEATGYGISADGDWLRTARGWVAAEIVGGTCAATDLLVIEETSEAYFAPMQSFTMSLGAGGSCDTAPTGLLIQAPTDQTANIMINDVELRVGSTAYVTFTDDDTMLIGNLEGDVTATSNGVGQPLQEGEGTTIEQGENGPSDPTDPAPLGDEIDNLTDDVLNALPRQIDAPQYVPPVTFTPSNDAGTDGQTTLGTWLPCGSCNTCGYPQNECVTSPEGACLWDPTTCREPSSAIVSGPNPVICGGYGESVFFEVRYNNPDGSSVDDAGVDGPGYVYDLNPNTVFVQGQCSDSPIAASVIVTVVIYATNGMMYTWSTQLIIP